MTRALPLAAAALFLGGCSDSTDSGFGKDRVATGDVVPDWSLEDVNATSPTAGEVVSPSDLRGQVSVWYYGHST